MLTNKLNTELTQSDLSTFGASQSTIQYLIDNDYHVVVKREWLEIWSDYKLYGVVSRMSSEQLNEWVEENMR